MVNSYVYYTGDGSTTNFQITFDYLSKEFVQVYLDGTLLEVETDYIFSGARTILIPSIPPSGSIVFIRRVTSKNRLVEFRDASILVANDLDVSALQAIHIAEEANDNIQNVIQADALGNFDALSRRLVNVGDPVDDTDGTNKLYVDTRLTADVSAAVAARDAAANSAMEALGYRNTAAAQVVLCQDQVQLTANQVLLAEGHADDAEQSALDAVAAVNSAAFTNMPIGSLVFVTGNTPANGTVAAQGELLSRAAYPDLWAYAQASGNISADDASWTKGQYSPGDGSTTFRVPNLQDQFIRGASGTRAVGHGEEDAIRNITGVVDLHGIAEPNFISGAWGAFYGAYGSATHYRSAGQLPAINGAPSNSRIILDASSIVPTSSENRPKNVAYLICIKAYDVISDPNVLNAVQVVNDINRLESEKLNRDEIVTPGDAPMYACRAWVSFNGQTAPPTILASGNVSSVVKVSTGQYNVNFIEPMIDGNWAGVIHFKAITTWNHHGTQFLLPQRANVAECSVVENGITADSPLVSVMIFR